MTKKTDYVQLVSIAAGLDYKDAKKQMNIARQNFGITYRDYYRKEFFKLTATQQAIVARRLRNRKKYINSSLDKISTATGLSHQEIRQQLKKFNQTHDLHFTIGLYAKFELYLRSESELAEFAEFLKKRRALKNELLEEFKRIDNHDLSYEDIEPQIKEFYALTAKITPESVMKSRVEKLQLSMPEIKTDSGLSIAASLDMEATIVLLSFSASEYVAFHMYGKTLEEKRAFITDKERMDILTEINSSEGIDLLDNKYFTYQRLSSFFRRGMVLITSEKDLDRFTAFCKGKGTVVVKPTFGTLGKGVIPLSIDNSADFRKLLSDLLNDYKEFILEDLIDSHRKIKKLNPDSVNTVRFTTYLDGDKVMIHDTFMKVGQKGSFVDNGGAGGILVHVNPVTGLFDSDGCTENGVIYPEHPQAGVRFKGYKLPKWKQARALACELAKSVPEIIYGGWDLTFTKDRKWVIVEGNAKTQFFGQQCTTDKGVREDFLNLVGYKK